MKQVMQPASRSIKKWHPIRSIGDFYSDLTDEDKKRAKFVAAMADRWGRQDIISEVASLKRRAAENAELVQLELRLEYERKAKEIKNGKS